MATPNAYRPKTEVLSQHQHRHLVCMKSIFCGLLVAIMVYMVLAALGAGVAGLRAESLIRHEENGSGLATGTGLWLGLSTVIALFSASYFALRISRYVTSRIGAAHGIVIASLFFIIMVIGAGGMLGGIARGLGSVAAQSNARQLGENPAVTDSLYKEFGTTSLKSPPQDVAQGLALRFMSGDTESAKNYYAYQSGLPAAEADKKVDQMKNDFDQAAKVAAEKTAHAVADTGWILFITFLIGLIASALGGSIGAQSNTLKPFSSADSGISASGMMRNQHGSALPYIFGWLLGVPTSILFLIFILRSIF